MDNTLAQILADLYTKDLEVAQLRQRVAELEGQLLVATAVPPKEGQ